MNPSAHLIDCFGASPPRPALWGRKVLIVDSSLVTAHSLTFDLEASGAEVITVGTPEQALEVSQAFCPDVLISKLTASNEDAYSLVQQIKAIAKVQRKSLLAIALVKSSYCVNQSQMLAGGFQYCFFEPVNCATAVSVINRFAEPATSHKIQSRALAGVR